jgi:hypothetical protein
VCVFPDGCGLTCFLPREPSSLGIGDTGDA